MTEYFLLSFLGSATVYFVAVFWNDLFRIWILVFCPALTFKQKICSRMTRKEPRKYDECEHVDLTIHNFYSDRIRINNTALFCSFLDFAILCSFLDSATVQLSLPILSSLDSAAMYFVPQLSGLCNVVLCFSAFWTLQQCTLFPSFLDSATMVREAAVDLVGKFILHKQELIDKYYDMLLPRILVSHFSKVLFYH
jgi:hypothetical protein